MKAIERYCEENNIIPNIIEKERLDLVLRLGIAELNKRDLESKGDEFKYRMKGIVNNG